MSEYLRIARELAEELFPGEQLTDEEVVRIAFSYAKGFREGAESERDKAIATALKGLKAEAHTKHATRNRKG